jgi:proton-coupled amino acid transporter
LEYLALTSLVGHFAGEDLSDSDQEEQERPDDEEHGEQTPLLSAGRQRYPNKAERRKLRRQQSQHDTTKHKTNVLKTVFLLFKAFIGSGILFLPKAFSNGGLAVAVAVIWLMGCISLYCFLLLLDCKKSIAGSYGDIGEATYGPWMRRIVLFSIAISQVM